MDFREFLRQGFVVLDGATGSNLQQAGMESGDCPEQWIAEHPEVFIDLQCRYIEAGSDVLYTPTFTCNRIKLDEYGLASKQEELTKTLVGLTKEAIRRSKADRKIYVAGDVSMTGQQLEPIGSMPFEELVDVYKQQVRLLAKEGVDLFAIETMMSLQECRAALLAVKETCDIPALVTLTYQEDGRTLYGTSPETALVVLQSMGADAIGINCSTGPDKMVDAVKAMAKYACVPLVVKPNAGLPRSENGKTVFDIAPAEFSELMEEIAGMGVQALGGCCGTTPEHLRLTIEKCRKVPFRPPVAKRRTVVSSFSQAVEIGPKPVIIGERINPTGKSKFKAALRENNIEYILGEGMAQEDSGAHILDVNVGLPEIDEPVMMERVVTRLQSVIALPLQIDTSDTIAMERGMRLYNGKPMINSVSGKMESMEAVFPLVRKYGGVVVGLALDENGIPSTA